jgi:uncharacterized delta-60 repeat protein
MRRVAPLLVGLLGCGGCGDGAGISLTTSSRPIAVSPGSSQSATVWVDAAGADVALTIDNLPPGVTADVVQVTAATGRVPARIVVHAAADAALGSYDAMVHAADARAPVHIQVGSVSGMIDTSYGDNGTTIEGFDDLVAPRLFVTARGELIVAGLTDNAFRLVHIMRFDPDGRLDRAFGAGGHVWLEGGGLVEAIAEQPDGALAVVCMRAPDPYRVHVAWRLSQSGAIDHTFGDSGRASLDVGEDSDVHAVRWLAGGELALSGNTLYDVFAARMTADGLMDATYGTRGVARARIDGYVRWTSLIHEDGSISGVGAYPDADGYVYRLTPAGALDPQFNATGYVLGIDWYYAIAALPGDRFVAGGQVYTGQGVVSRWAPDGSALDRDKQTLYDAEVVVSLATHGEKVVAIVYGYVNARTNLDMAVIRLGEDGVVDPSFGVGGKVGASFGLVENARYDRPYGLEQVMVDSAGRIYVAHGMGKKTWAITRLLP